jgi:hypothetical protein
VKNNVSHPVRTEGVAPKGVTRRRASELNLTAEERAMLPDPEWVTEDDADAIVGLRRLKTEQPISLDELLTQLGLERSDLTKRR